MTETLRTPEDRFADLPDWPYAPHYVEVTGGRMAYVDEGAGARTVLCLHGQPTWSYLYRKMIPTFVAAGHRVVAPDLLGFGRSDKPVDDASYTFDFHRRSLLDFLAALDTQAITLVVQDWGGLLGLTLPMEDARIDRLFVMNTALAVGETPGEGFLAWRAWVAANPDFAISRLMQRSCPDLTQAEAAAYDAPFPDARHRAGVRRFPQLVPDAPDAPGAEISRRAARFLAEDWTGRSYVACGTQDPVFGPDHMRRLAAGIAGAPPVQDWPEGGHFTQEIGAPLAAAGLKALA